MRFSADPLAIARDDLAACRILLGKGSHSFALAARLLPARTRDAATGLYAFCRIADDLIDQAADMRIGLAEVRSRVDGIFENRPADHPADRVLAALVTATAMPRAPVDALVEGFAWDSEGRSYVTLSDVLAYAARVAGSVGVMMSHVMGRHDPAALARAADLGMAMQLTNIVRDIGEDARRGRLYLPSAWLQAEGLDPAIWLAAPMPHPALRKAALRLLGEADRLYRRGEFGIALLEPACRPAIRAARLIYAEIGAAILADSDHDMLSRRIVPARRKLALLAQSLSRLPDESRPYVSISAPPPQAEALFLWESPAEGTRFQRPVPARWDLGGRFLRLLPLFERLAEAERA